MFTFKRTVVRCCNENLLYNFFKPIRLDIVISRNVEDEIFIAPAYDGTTESQKKHNLIRIIRDFTSSSDTNKDCVELVEVERVGLLVVNTWSMVSPLHLPAPPPATVSLSFKRLLQGGPSMMWFLASVATAAVR